MLLPILLALVPAQTEVAPPPDAAANTPPAAPADSCAALFGEAARGDERRASREERLEGVSRSENLLDITHSDAGWRAPKPMRVPGMEVVAIEDGADGARTARVRVGEAWSERCEPGEYRLGVDDGLGSDGLVLAIVDEGVLAEHKGELIFVPRLGSGPPPFRMIWRSAFALNVAPGSNAAIGGSSTGNAKARRNTRATTGRDASASQRARAQAKAAAESRRAVSSRANRPRG